MTTPVMIIAHDRLTCLENLIKWFESIGEERIYIVDNESTYEPLLEFYEKTPHTVYRIENHGPSSPWRVPELEWTMEHEHFIVTDPDVYPTQDCPDNVIERCCQVLNAMGEIDKVGPSLEINDIPDSNPRKAAIQGWEGQFWTPHRLNATHGIWNSPIDTTFAVYRPGTPYKITEAVRLDRPYVFHHLPWYLDFNNLSEEEKYYTDHAGDWITTWSKEDLPDHYKEMM